MFKNQALLKFVFVLFSLLFLSYFIITVEPRGDESEYYLAAFMQAYSKWPALDWDSLWSLSAPYLWILSAAHFVFGNLLGVDIIISGRILSAMCWLFFLSKSIFGKRPLTPWFLVVLFNPYLLVYATRAHGVLLGLVAVYGFYRALVKKQKIGYLWLTFAVTMQVYMGAVSAMLLPEKVKDISKKAMVKVVVGVVAALAGVGITWYTWGGVYPEAFKNSEFFQALHVNGKSSFSYFPLVFMLMGGFLWGLGRNNLCQISSSWKWGIIAAIMAGCIGMYFGKCIVGVVPTGIGLGLPIEYVHGLSIVVYGILGLGWLRLHRNHFLLIMGCISAAILLSTLPYLYERLASFGTFAPITLWVLMNQNEKRNNKLIISICIVGLVLALFYQQFGAL